MFAGVGEVFVGPGFRICSRSGCKWPATASLSFNYGTRQTWLEELMNPPEITHYDICNVHAGRFTPPHGWSLEDRRERSLRSVERPAAEPSPRVETAERWEDRDEPEDDKVEAFLRPSLLDHSPDWKPRRINPGGSRGPAATGTNIVPVGTPTVLPRATDIQAAFPES